MRAPRLTSLVTGHGRARLVWATLVTCALSLSLLAQSRQTAYTVYTAQGRRTLAVQTTNGVETAQVEHIAALFGLTVSEDALVGGFVLRGRGTTILLIPGQALASVGPGRIVTLPGPFERQRNAWYVPVDFIRLAVGPALNTRVDQRQASRTLLIGDVRLPRVTGQFERQGANARIVLDIQPANPHRITRQGARVTVQFDAVALDYTPIPNVAAEFAAAIRVDGTALHIDFGPSTTNYRSVALDASRLAIELLAPAPEPAPAASASEAPPSTPAPLDRPVIDPSPGRLRTVVLDPGHGGDDTGALAADGTSERDLVLQFARRLKTTIEGRLGVRVILTRDGEADVPPDRRASMANTNKADLFLSIHAGGSRHAGPAGAQVMTLRLADYAGRQAATTATELPVAFVGGGTRTIDLLPWDLAQVGFTRESATLADLLLEHLASNGVPLLRKRSEQLPLRPLVGASMPAVLLELGSLSNAADAAALKTPERAQRAIEAVMGLLVDIKDGIPSDRPAQ